MPVFTQEEYQRRVKRTQESMQEKGIDLLIVSQPANMNYLTGYDGWSFYVHQCVLVSLNQEEPMW
ncbi:MAG: aminopeptidase P family N-terminal domain-containing protein, partial [Spirochaetota bacterium]|nr:aminopeptidase P family N-terminal domain-containing protein [Spirochaetota bacterium]